jgi:hypothetical protein
MFYYTNHSDMGAPQYVHVDVPSGYPRYRIFYYTHHRDMYVQQYVAKKKKKKGSNSTILKRCKKLYEVQVTNQLN